MVTIPTIAEIRDQILGDIESSLGQSVPLLAKAVFRILATAMAGAQYLLYKLGAWLYYQIFTLTMDDDALTARAAEFGLARNPATIWKGTATATGTDGTIIAVGTLFSYNSYVYQTLTAVTVSGGTATLSLKSLEGGDDVTLADSTEINLVTPQTGLDDTATVASTTQSGEDLESLADFRARILYRQRNKPQGGAIADFNGWALEVAGIGEAYTFRPAPGYVNVYPLADEADPADRIPDGAKLTEVSDYINLDSRLPFGRSCTVLAFSEIEFDVDITNLSPDTTAIRASIESAVEDYMYARRPQQYEDELDPINVVSQAEVTAIVISAGAQVATVTLKNAGGSPITSYELEDDELAVLRTLSWV